MEVLVAVVDDLWVFLRQALFGRVITVAPVQPALTEPADATTDSFVEVVTERQSNELETLSSPALLHAGEQYYVGAIDARVYADPVIAFDNALELLPYGKSVRLLQLQGRWAQIRYNDFVGWVLKDMLCSALSDVFPTLTPDELYPASDTETVKLRACIDDMFGGGRGMFALTAEEYVSYRLWRQKRSVTWGEERARVAGTWQRKLKGKQGIYIRITPKTDSVMEYVVDDIGYLAYVEAVHPDNSIKLSEVRTDEGSRYREYVLSTEEWRELRPVFITVA